mgnify:CR=1 FL=1
MPNKLFIILCICFSFSALSQENDDKDKKDNLPKTEEGIIIEGEISTRPPIDPLTPARAAFYSAVLPGLGQAYNK